MPRKVAIVLHGPPAIGKSTVWGILNSQYQAKRISLDDGWMPNEFRFRGGPGRYADLANEASQLLVIELGIGEPYGRSFDGATKGAHEWVQVLKNASREIFAFRLSASPEHAIRRVTERAERRSNGNTSKHSMISDWQHTHDLYARRSPVVTFPPIEGFQETVLDTSERSPEEVCAEIAQTVNLAEFQKN